MPDGRPFILTQDSGFQKTIYPIIAEPEWEWGKWPAVSKPVSSCVTRLDRSIHQINIQKLVNGQNTQKTLSVREVQDRSVSNHLKYQQESLLQTTLIIPCHHLLSHWSVPEENRTIYGWQPWPEGGHLSDLVLVHIGKKIEQKLGRCK